MYQHGGDIYHNKIMIDFSTNTNFAGMPPGVIYAAMEGVLHSDRYPDTSCQELREAIGSALGVSKDWIVCGNGAADLIFSLVLALKPKNALLPIPAFYEYEQALRTVECDIEYALLREEEGFHIQEDFLDKISADTDMIFLCNPHNPTGNLIDQEILKKIIDCCEVNGIWLVIDECFMDFIEDKHDNSVLEQLAYTKHLFILKAFTKLYSMPGLRLGYGICPNEKLLKHMRKVSQPWSVSIPAQLAGIAALQEVEYVVNSLENIRRERAYLINELLRLNVKVYGSKANYIFFRGEPGLYDLCLEEGILIRDCSNYKGLEAGYYRICVNNREENEQLIEVFEEIYNTIFCRHSTRTSRYGENL